MPRGNSSCTWSRSCFLEVVWVTITMICVWKPRWHTDDTFMVWGSSVYFEQSPGSAHAAFSSNSRLPCSFMIFHLIVFGTTYLCPPTTWTSSERSQQKWPEPRCWNGCVSVAESCFISSRTHFFLIVPKTTTIPFQLGKTKDSLHV